MDALPLKIAVFIVYLLRVFHPLCVVNLDLGFCVTS
ncbi:hypothetical protein ECO55CA74_13070 [Escherichia coli O55:H7 str. RM12579]|nr:hypothetical protein ECO55CA74_13070 [Escherichia coli O55:H7 str. RM12579]